MCQIFSNNPSCQICKRTNGKAKRFRVRIPAQDSFVWLVHSQVSKKKRFFFFFIWTLHFCIFSFNPFQFFPIFPPLSPCVYLYKEDTECSYPVSLLKYEPKGIKTNFVFCLFDFDRARTSAEVISLTALPDTRFFQIHPCKLPSLLINIAPLL